MYRPSSYGKLDIPTARYQPVTLLPARQGKKRIHSIDSYYTGADPLDINRVSCPAFVLVRIESTALINGACASRSSSKDIVGDAAILP